MKQFLVIALVIVTIFSCNKRAGKQSAKMTASELKAKYGIDLIGEEATARAGNGKGKAKADQLVVVWFNDLVLTSTGGDSFSSTVSENAQWFGYQLFVDTTTTDGATSYCNRYYNSQAESPETESCTIAGTGFVRTFTSDFDYNVHISNVIQK